MNIWGVLEIEPTNEVSMIKKAYAKKLKVYHPEEDPEGYQRLRECFDAALKFAKNQNVVMPHEKAMLSTEEIKFSFPKPKPFDDNVRVENIEDNDNISFPKVNLFEPHVDEEVLAQKLVDELFTRLEELYNDFFRRIELKNWQEILNCEIMWNMSYEKVIDNKMLGFLMEHNHLPKNIWQYLNKNFHWDEKEKYLNSSFPKEFIQYLLNQIGEERSLRYCYFRKEYKIDFDQFIYYRSQAAVWLLRNDLKKAENFLSLANDMYKIDPDLLCLQGELFIKMSKLKKAEKSFSDAVKLNPKDTDTRLFQAIIYYRNKLTTPAIKTCKYILKDKPDNFHARIILGKCYVKDPDWKKANKILLENLKIRPSDAETRECLNMVNNRLLMTIRKSPWRFKIRGALKKNYTALGENNQIDNIRFNKKDFSRTVKFFLITFFLIGLFFSNPVLGAIGIFIRLMVSRRKR